MGEFELINWIRQQTPAAERVMVGPGDDAAVLAPGSAPLLLTTDMLLEGSHFRLPEVAPERVGRKAMAVNLSDIAAMAGRPLAAVVSLGLPRKGAGQGIAEALFRGLRQLADEFATPLVGGDTNSWNGPLSICITLLGEVTGGRAVLRCGARVGDWIMVTGPLGGSILGKQFDFVPRIHEAQMLHGLVELHAMMDISDGLAADLQHICEESACGAVLHADRIPISDAAHALRDHQTPLEHALGDGEDFELLFTVAPADGQMLLSKQPIPGIQLLHIGECIAERKLLLEAQGSVTPCAPRGYVHQL
jgi:thiamine-monophosphate kinase